MPQEIPIVFEDAHLIALNKPSLLHSVRSAESGHESLADYLIGLDDAYRKVAASPDDAGLIQRLDFETSGLILAAKSRAVWTALRGALSAGQIFKSYVVLVGGNFTETQISRVYIGSPYRRGKKVRVTKTKKARYLEATSRFEPLAYSLEDDCTLLKASIGPGRRHQIRAHLAFLGFPLIGDSLYGSKRNLGTVAFIDSPRLLPAFFLHAARIKFKHPISAETIDLIAPPPDYIRISQDFIP